MSITRNYKFIEKIYTDSHFDIFRAIRKLDGSLVSIKTVRPRHVSLGNNWLQNEYKITQQLDCAQIIRSYSLENHYNSPAIVLESFTGESLSQFLKNSLSLEQFITIAIDLVKSLQIIHQHQIIHQNFQPSSIFIDPKTLKTNITNFSIATNFEDRLETFSQQLKVTNLAYISPEQTDRTNLAIDYRTDFYSLGIIFYRLLTGQLPYNALNSLKLMHCHLAQTPVSPHHLKPNIGKMLSAIVMKLIAKNPEERYQNSYGIIADLKICQNRDKNKPFVCGQFDRYGQFVISSRLYGLSDAADVLTSSLTRVQFGATEITLVKGSSGIGKTTFMWQTVKANIRQRDYLIATKCEQLTSNIPYRLVIQVFNSIIEQLLTESSESLRVWRSKILLALGQDARVITELVPNIELIIDRQPNVPELSPSKTKARFHSVLTKFMRIFACQEHSLILLLDDLQWIDSASLKLLEFLSNNFDSGYLLIVGAYRDDTECDRPLADAIARIRPNTIVNDITLKPLNLEQVDRWLSDTFNCQERTLPLAKLLFERTKGNPFFLHQLLQTLYSEKLIVFDFERLIWRWQIEEIQRATIANCNVVDLVINNLAKLPHTSQKIIQIAACIGEHFELAILEIITEQTSAQLVKELELALKAGIILFDCPQGKHRDLRSNCYKFLNDRLRQTAYTMLDEVDNIYIHLKIGRFLLQQTNPDRIEEQIFNLTKHLNLAKKFFWLSPFAPRLAEFNLKAAQSAKTATAYEVAADYLNIALELLSPFSWQTHCELKTSVYLEASEIQYLQTNFTRAEKLGDVVIARETTVLDKVKAFEIKIRSHIAQSQMQLAIDEGLHTLELLGILFSDRAASFFQSTTNVSAYLDCFQSDLKMSDPISLAAMEILAIIVPPVYIVKLELFPQIVFKMVELTQQHGNCRLRSYVDVLCGLWLSVAGDIEAGYQLGKLAATSKRSRSKAIEPKVELVFNSMIRHWKEPAVYTLEAFLAGIEGAIEVGDIEHACFHAKYYCTYLFLVGEPLASASEKAGKQIESIEGFKQTYQLHYARIWQQLNLNLQGLVRDKQLGFGDLDESKMLQLWHETNNATSLFAFHLAKLILYYIFRDHHQAAIEGGLGKQYLNAAVGSMCYGAYYFYYSLALLAICSTKSELQSYLPEIKSYQLQLKKWAVYAPENYQHKYELVSAEIARILEDNELAAEHYDRAIIEAEQAGYLHEAALAEELTGEFYLGLNRIKIAKLYLNDACQRYQLWGAIAKVEDLQRRHSQLLTSNDVNELVYPDLNFKDRNCTLYCKTSSRLENLATFNLDLFSVIKASQAISSEIVLDNLISKMMDIVMENAGAQKSILFLQQGSTLVVAASATVTSENKAILPYVPITEYADIPTSIINYVQSTHNTVILDRATREGMFTQDSYVVEHHPKSILSCPIVYQNQLQGIIYLENSLVEAAFTPQKSEILQVLLFQVSISIENARLYKNLENHASVQESLAQKEILLKEIHHRVKNNLLVVSSLLDLQSSYICDSKVIKLLENCQNRITAMALVHQHLYGNSKLNKINFDRYIESLVDNLAYLHGSQDRNINLILAVEPIEINIESANPCGLIVNELVSNALEHGFVDRDEGNIWISLQVNSLNQNVLTIEDDGVGFKNDLDLYNSDSLGLELVCTLVEQIDGEIKLDRSNGTKIEITFTELDYHSRI